ncbi:MAG: amidohydrolase family protein [Acidobacteria bacterium]|nr:amidohydrolase family protein [Acidobacteriota bacterium]
MRFLGVRAGPRVLIVLAFWAAAVLRADAPAVYAIRNARIVTVSGPELPKATVVVRDGLIEAVGEDVAVPVDAWPLEGEGLTVYPGLIDGLSTLGITDESALAPAAARPSSRSSVTSSPPGRPAAGPEDRPRTTSWLNAADLVRITDRRLESARSAGFTTAVTFPARGIFAGQGAVINLAAARSGGLVVASPVAQYVSFSSGSFSEFPGSLMGLTSYVRQLLLDAGYYRSAKARYEKNVRDAARPVYDRALEGVLAAPRILLPAQTRTQIARMTHFAAELNVPVVLYGVHDGYRAAGVIAKAGVPVLVSLKWPEKDREADPEDTDSLRVLELRAYASSTPHALAAAGVKFGFYSGGIERPGDILRNVRRAVDAGLDRAAAVRALTLSTAEIFGVADRLGSIERGKIANLLVTRGDLFEERMKVEYVLIDGVKYLPLPEAPPREERQ